MVKKTTNHSAVLVCTVSDLNHIYFSMYLPIWLSASLSDQYPTRAQVDNVPDALMAAQQNAKANCQSLKLKLAQAVMIH